MAQATTALPAPPGMLWRDPGFPSLLVTYSVGNDFFFSGHTAFAVFGAPVWAELWFGACNSQRVVENQARIRELASHVTSLPFDDRAAEHCGEIRALLARQGCPIGPYDLQIAAIARSSGLRLVTHNVSEFSRVPGLSIENWQGQA